MDLRKDMLGSSCEVFGCIPHGVRALLELENLVGVGEIKVDPLKPMSERSTIKSENTGKEELLFVSFCVEMYARRHGMDGGDVFRLFDEKGVCDFLVDCYDPLHSQGREYILDEIELFMKGASNNANA